jgi:GNAT superfamily N-acetyltransferase
MMLDIEGWSPPAVVSTSLRTATQPDLEQVLDMHRRCSVESLYRRYVSGAGAPPPAHLARLLEPVEGRTLLAVVSGGPADGRVVASGNLIGCGDGTAEAAILVEDAWQRRGLGTLLARGLAAEARAGGFSAVIAHVLTGNQPALRTIRRLTGDGTLRQAGGVEFDGPLMTLRLHARH